MWKKYVQVAEGCADAPDCRAEGGKRQRSTLIHMQGVCCSDSLGPLLRFRRTGSAKFQQVAVYQLACMMSMQATVRMAIVSDWTEMFFSPLIDRIQQGTGTGERGG